jgi:hypothetical protein
MSFVRIVGLRLKVTLVAPLIATVRQLLAAANDAPLKRTAAAETSIDFAAQRRQSLFFGQPDAAEGALYLARQLIDAAESGSRARL